jgi:hypothetical protein
VVGDSTIQYDLVMIYARKRYCHADPCGLILPSLILAMTDRLGILYIGNDAAKQHVEDKWAQQEVLRERTGTTVVRHAVRECER